VQLVVLISILILSNCPGYWTRALWILAFGKVNSERTKMDCLWCCRLRDRGWCWCWCNSRLQLSSKDWNDWRQWRIVGRCRFDQKAEDASLAVLNECWTNFERISNGH
jgi:hypothetical protein